MTDWSRKPLVLPETRWGGGLLVAGVVVFEAIAIGGFVFNLAKAGLALDAWFWLLLALATPFGTLAAVHFRFRGVASRARDAVGTERDSRSYAFSRAGLSPSGDRLEPVVVGRGFLIVSATDVEIWDDAFGSPTIITKLPRDGWTAEAHRAYAGFGFAPLLRLRNMTGEMVDIVLVSGTWRDAFGPSARHVSSVAAVLGDDRSA